MNSRQIFLLVAAIGLVHIVLSYGLQPATSLEFLFGVSVPDVNGTHMFRAIMGLYLAMVVFWLLGAYRVHFRQAALYGNGGLLPILPTTCRGVPLQGCQTVGAPQRVPLR
jgi:hypothetical protein